MSIANWLGENEQFIGIWKKKIEIPSRFDPSLKICAELFENDHGLTTENVQPWRQIKVYWIF